MSEADPLSRRPFGVRLASASGAALPARHPRAPLKPARLWPDDLVALVAPAGHIDETAISRAIHNLQGLGLRVRLSDNLRAVRGNYAGTVQERLDDLHAQFRDPDVKALWAVRGGSGSIALLSQLDYGLIGAHPKILVGYSDITALHLAIWRQTGLVTFHGPVASSIWSDYTVAQLRAVLMQPVSTHTIAMSEDNRRKAAAEPQFGLRVLRGGRATGRLIGGNLSLVTALAGTPCAADFRDSILFLEDVNEAPYRIDRMLCQLQLAQGLGRAAGVVLGVFENCGPQGGELSLSFDETVDQHLQPLTIPAVSGYSFGHIRHQFTLPVGVMATLDTAQQTLTLREPAVL